MIKTYSPVDGENDHKIRISFNKDGYRGSIVTLVGGNCRGISVIEAGMDFIEDCSEEDVERLVSNDCAFNIRLNEDEDIFTFDIALYNDDGKKLALEDVDEDAIRDIITGVEIEECTPSDE